MFTLKKKLHKANTCLCKSFQSSKSNLEYNILYRDISLTRVHKHIDAASNIVITMFLFGRHIRIFTVGSVPLPQGRERQLDSSHISTPGEASAL